MKHDERYEVRNPDIERYLRTLATLIDEEVPEGWGWGLFLVKHGDNPKAPHGPSPDGAGAVFWISNSERAGMIDCVQDWIDDNKRRARSDTGGGRREAAAVTTKDTARLLDLKKSVEAMTPGDQLRLCAGLVDEGSLGSLAIAETLAARVLGELQLVRMLGSRKSQSEA